MADETLPQAAPLPPAAPQAVEEPAGLDQFVSSLSGAGQPAQAPTAEPPGLDSFIADEVHESKYGSGEQQLKTLAEGIASGATLGAARPLESYIGIAKPKDILERSEENRLASSAGEVLGLPLTGAAGVLEKAGAAGVKALGLGAAESTAAKIGSAAVKSAIENAVFQGTNELSKMALDPNRSAQTAAIDVGLAGLLGGGIGAGIGSVSPLWKATLGKQTEGVLKAVSDRLGGIEGQLPDHLEEALKSTGVNISPDVKAAMMNDPYVKHASEVLQDAATGSGIKHQEAIKQAKQSLSDAVASALGRTPEDVAALKDLSAKDAGDQIKTIISDRVKTKAEPIDQSYEKIRGRFKEVPFAENIKSELSEAVAKTLDSGASLQSDEAKLVQRVIGEIPSIKNLEQLRNYTSGLGRETKGINKADLWPIASKLRNALNEAEDKALTTSVESDAPELVAEHAATKQSYKELKNLIGDINDRIKVGPHSGPKTFVNALSDMDGEMLLNRLNPKGKAALIGELQTHFPEVADIVKNYHLDQLIKKATKTVQPGEIVNANTLIKSIKELSPEMRDFILPAGATEKLEAIEALKKAIPEKANKSGTAKAMDGLMSKMPDSAVATAYMLLGHNPITAVLVGTAGKFLGRTLPDAARLSMLKFLGSSAPIESEGFKAMADVFRSTIKGENLMARTTKDIFNAGRTVIP